jgi:hypothetical protein
MVKFLWGFCIPVIAGFCILADRAVAGSSREVLERLVNILPNTQTHESVYTHLAHT